MGRWARENDFDQLVRTAIDSVANHDGDWPISKERAFALVKGIVAAESTFDPNATRGETQMGDASIGLMQVLYSTAKGLGYGGTVQGLYDPLTNLYLGSKLLRQLLEKTGSEGAAASAYNGGIRPALGFGLVRSASTPRVCIRWKPGAPSTNRNIDRDCEVVGSVLVGTYSNQGYVDRVKSYTDYFFRNRPSAGDGLTQQTGKTSKARQEVPIEGGSHQVNLPLVVGLAGALGALLLLKGRRGK